MIYQRINRNSLAQFWKRRLPLLPTWRGGTYNAGRNKAKRAARGTGDALSNNIEGVSK